MVVVVVVVVVLKEPRSCSKASGTGWASLETNCAGRKRGKKKD